MKLIQFNFFQIWPAPIWYINLSGDENASFWYEAQLGPYLNIRVVPGRTENSSNDARKQPRSHKFIQLYRITLYNWNLPDKRTSNHDKQTSTNYNTK